MSRAIAQPRITSDDHDDLHRRFERLFEVVVGPVAARNDGGVVDRAEQARAVVVEHHDADEERHQHERLDRARARPRAG